MLGRNLESLSCTSGNIQAEKMKQNANPTTSTEATKAKYRPSYPAHGGYENVQLLTFYLISPLTTPPLNFKSFGAEEDSAI